MNYCDYCTCSDCKNGSEFIAHAQTINKNWICDVCYMYDLCTSYKGHNGPCKNMDCIHRPKIITKFIK